LYRNKYFDINKLIVVIPTIIDIRKRAIIIENVTIKRRMELALTGENIITYTAASIFLPYILTAITLAFITIYIIANKQTRQLVFIHKGCSMLKLFFIYILVIPFMYRNWLGIAVGLGMILAFTLGLYLRSVMTRDLYERILTMICTLSLTSAAYAITEAIANFLFDAGHSHRISSVFSHPNYFGTIVGTVIIICAYKLLTNQQNKWFYYMVIGFNVISMYLCKSMFVFVEVFIGVVILLVIQKKHKLLILWLSSAVLGAFLVLVVGVNLIPRLYDVTVTVSLRQKIWQLAWGQIKQSPLFGHGFMSFSYLFNTAYHNRLIPHSHSIYLDMLLNFGIVGSMLFLWYFAKYYISVITTCFKKNNIIVGSLILAVTGAALVHGATDLTLLWIQTLPLFLVILAGQGSEEKTEQYAVALNYSNSYSN